MKLTAEQRAGYEELAGYLQSSNQAASDAIRALLADLEEAEGKRANGNMILVPADKLAAMQAELAATRKQLAEKEADLATSGNTGTDKKPVAWACWFDFEDMESAVPGIVRREPFALAQRRPLVYGDDLAAQLEQARREERAAFRAAILAESREWTGDYRGPVFRAFEAVARRLGVNLTRHQCEDVSQGRGLPDEA